MNYTIPFVLAVLLFSSCTSKSSVDTVEVTSKSNDKKITPDLPFVNPPLKEVDILFQDFEFDAESGADLFSESGSILTFPPQCFIDEQGENVIGKVAIRYREFNDPVDFFLSGIPMSYDSAGTTYDFESSGMFEMLAFADEKAVFINPDARPKVNLVTKDTRTIHNLYYLDTVAQRWVNKGKDSVIDVTAENKKIANQKGLAAVSKAVVKLPAPPVEPKELNPEKPSFSIDLLPGVAPELQAYKNLIFEIAKNEKSYNPKDANEQWVAVEVENGDEYGLYLVTFTSFTKKVSYICRPVFKGADYDQAILLFEEKQKEYNEKHKESIAQAKAQAKVWADRELAIEQYNDSMKIINGRIERLNALIAKRNKEFESQNIKTNQDQESKSIEADLFRTFVIPKLGVWNCDNPNLRKGYYTVANFKDQSGVDFVLSSVTVVYKSFNGARKYGAEAINFIPNSDCMIWGVHNQQLVYLTYKEFNACNISADTETFTFTMNRVKKKIKSVADVRKYLKL